VDPFYVVILKRGRKKRRTRGEGERNTSIVHGILAHDQKKKSQKKKKRKEGKRPCGKGEPVESRPRAEGR